LKNVYCGREGEIVKLVFVGIGESLTNWLLRAWGIVDKLVIVGVWEIFTN
jgi:hypothetical protein